jgi:hypothetical protein
VVSDLDLLQDNRVLIQHYSGQLFSMGTISCHTDGCIWMNAADIMYFDKPRLCVTYNSSACYCATTLYQHINVRLFECEITDCIYTQSNIHSQVNACIVHKIICIPREQILFKRCWWIDYFPGWLLLALACYRNGSLILFNTYTTQFDCLTPPLSYWMKRFAWLSLSKLLRCHEIS